jgi:4-amino-4-deoxy-L-arabinose transferase-like glycosyltransferase
VAGETIACAPAVRNHSPGKILKAQSRKPSPRLSKAKIYPQPRASNPPVDAAFETWEMAGYVTRWTTLRSYIFLSLITIACLLPFSGRAFHVDDTLFVWAAQQIRHHPFDPYGFQLIWDATRVPMASVTQNPPLCSYFTALIGSVLGWSERALHSGFILVALALVLGTYRLARSFTRSPLLAALATLLTPGVLVSASSVMCDTMMLALWIWAAIFWVEGLKIENARRAQIYFFIASGFLIAASALTKYFGVALIPLLLAYAVVQKRRLGMYLLYLLIPVAALCAYQIWTAQLYGHGLLGSAADFAASQRAATQGSVVAMAIVGLSFTGGCCLLGWIFAPFLWSRTQLAIGAAISGLAALIVMMGWINMGLQLGGGVAVRLHLLTGIQLLLAIGGGISVVALSVIDVRKNRDADALFLALWIGGTFVFAAFVNYTVNARSVLPLIPAAGILLARRFDELRLNKVWRLDIYVAMILLASGGFSFWIAAGDSSLANSARTAATQAVEKTRGKGGTVWFEGHWGFQYYMESLGARPLDFGNPQLAPGDFVVIPQNNIQLKDIPAQYVAARESIELPQNIGATTISSELGAGFYSSYWGPLPYAVGPVQPERYWIIQLAKMPARPTQ